MILRASHESFQSIHKWILECWSISKNPIQMQTSSGIKGYYDHTFNNVCLFLTEIQEEEEEEEEEEGEKEKMEIVRETKNNYALSTQKDTPGDNVTETSSFLRLLRLPHLPHLPFAHLLGILVIIIVIHENLAISWRYSGKGVGCGGDASGIYQPAGQWISLFSPFWPTWPSWPSPHLLSSSSSSCLVFFSFYDPAWMYYERGGSISRHFLVGVLTLSSPATEAQVTGDGGRIGRGRRARHRTFLPRPPSSSHLLHRHLGAVSSAGQPSTSAINPADWSVVPIRR